MISKKTMKKVAAVLICGATIITMGAKNVSAHGYIQGSRVELAKRGINQNAGQAQYEPQSVEGPGNFPIGGPADGQIAGAGNFPELDAQSKDRWTKVPMNGGVNTFTWTLTAPHRTAEWKYYITKKGWNPDKAITRDDLELITVIDEGGAMPLSTVTHTINVPTDRTGYYVILGVWEIADTGNAFYQVIDVDLSNNGSGEEVKDTVAPTIPANLKSVEKTTNTVGLIWDASNDNVGVHHYNVYRNGQKVQVAQGTAIVDNGLQANTEYEYKVTAVDAAGNESNASESIKVKTKELPTVDIEAPTAPTGVHSMGETDSSIDVMWIASVDNVGVDHYELYRDGVKIKDIKERRYNDIGLKADTEYTYVIRAVDAAGNVSEESAPFKARTAKSDNENQNPDEPSQVTTWDKNEVYVQGDKVMYDGIEYTAKWWTKGDKPGEASVWEMQAGVVLEWSSIVEYKGGDRVIYNGATYEAKWWTKGDKPGISSVWQKL